MSYPPKVRASYQPRHAASGREPMIMDQSGAVGSVAVSPVLITHTDPPPSPRARASMFAVRLVAFGMGAAAFYLVITGGNLGGLDPEEARPGQAAHELTTAPPPTSAVPSGVSSSATTAPISTPRATDSATRTPGGGRSSEISRSARPDSPEQLNERSRHTAVITQRGDRGVVATMRSVEDNRCAPLPLFCFFRR